jgi:hypothetical protein
MKRHSTPSTLLLACLLLVLCMPVCVASAAEKKMPEALQAIATKATNLAAAYAKQLDGAWGDQHAAMIASKKKNAFADYAKMRSVLSGFVAKKEATYVYTLYPSAPSDKAPFFLTVDGAVKPDDYGTEYKWEAGFAAAWKGTPTAADHAWKDDKGKGILISAYAPIRDSKGNVVAILGVDYPAPGADKFPGWVRAE